MTTLAILITHHLFEFAAKIYWTFNQSSQSILFRLLLLSNSPHHVIVLHHRAGGRILRLGGRKKNSGEGLTKKGKKGNLGPEPTLRRRGGAKKVVRRGRPPGPLYRPPCSTTTQYKYLLTSWNHNSQDDNERARKTRHSHARRHSTRIWPTAP